MLGGKYVFMRLSGAFVIVWRAHHPASLDLMSFCTSGLS